MESHHRVKKRSHNLTHTQNKAELVACFFCYFSNVWSVSCALASSCLSQKTGNALRALGRMAMLSANRRSPSLSPTSTRSLSEVTRSESLDSENLDDRREEDESLEHSASEGEIAKKSDNAEDEENSKIEEELKKEEIIEDVGEEESLAMSIKEQASEQTEKDVCEAKHEDSVEKDVEVLDKSDTELVVEDDDVNVCNETGEDTEVIPNETEEVVNVHGSNNNEKKNEDSDEEVSESKETAEDESDEITVIEKEKETVEEESLDNNDESEKNGSDESLKENKADDEVVKSTDSSRSETADTDSIRSTLEKSCDVMDEVSNSSTIENSVFLHGISKPHLTEPTNNGTSMEVQGSNNKETNVAAGFKANKDIAFDRELTRRSFRKFNTQLEGLLRFHVF